MYKAGTRMRMNAFPNAKELTEDKKGGLNMNNKKDFIVMNKVTGVAYTIKDYKNYEESMDVLEWNKKEMGVSEMPKFQVADNLSNATMFDYNTGKYLLENQLETKSMSNIKFNRATIYNTEGKKVPNDENYKIKNLILVQLIETDKGLSVHPFYSNYIVKK